MKKFGGFTPAMWFGALEPGSAIAVPYASQHEVEDAITEFAGADSDWEITLWTDPINQHKDETARFVHVLRSEGMSPAEIERRRQATMTPHHSIALDSFVFAPLTEGWKASDGSARRKSTRRWESMSVGDQRVMRSPIRDVKRVVGNAIAGRGLDWEFRIIRMRDAEKESGMPTPMWRIIRVK